MTASREREVKAALLSLAVAVEGETRQREPSPTLALALRDAWAALGVHLRDAISGERMVRTGAVANPSKTTTAPDPEAM